MLQPGDHGSTFAGGPVIAAGANAVLDVIGEEGFLTPWPQSGERLSTALGGLGLDVRGRGLMLAFATDDAPALARRLLPSSGWWSTPPAPTPIRLLPPLTVSEDEIDEAVARIGAAL